VTIRSVGELDYTDYNYIQFCNILLRKCMEGLDLQELGRNYFDPTEAISLKEYKLELWPGYVTSIRQHERDLLLCCEISNKILRTDTVRDQIIAAYQKDKTNYRSVAQRLLLGCIVITRYNNKTYKIDDISWEETPMKTFPVSFNF
jgi:aubergine-like protein